MLDKLVESNKEAVLKHYGKTEDDLNNDIEHIKQWLNKQPHLPDVPETMIRAFLIRKKFSLEKTKQTIDTYYRLKHLVPEVFSEWDMQSPEIQQAFNTCVWIPIPKLTPECNGVSIMRLYDTDANKFDIWAATKLSIMTVFLRMQAECNIGEHIILDYKGWTISHMTKYTPTYIKKLYAIMMKGCSLKVFGFHILNAPPMLDTLLSILKVVMKPKLYNRIKIHNSLESLHAHVSREILPKEYGGDEISMCDIRDLWKKEMEAHRDFFIEDEKYMQSDESKRIDNLDEDIFGSMHGSFRKLQID